MDLDKCTIDLQGLAFKADYGVPKADPFYGSEDWPVPTTAEAWNSLDRTLPGQAIDVFAASGQVLGGTIVEFNSRLGEVMVFVVDDSTQDVQCRTIRAEFSPLAMDVPPTLH